MGLFDKIKKAFSREPVELVDPEQELLDELQASSTIEPYVRGLRVEWLNGRKGPLAPRMLAVSDERFPEHEALRRILRAVYLSEKVDQGDPPLFEYAASLTRTTNFAIEGYLYRTGVLLETGRRHQAISSLIRAVTSERPELDLLRWRLALLCCEGSAGLQGMADRTLGSDDGAVALLLARAMVESAYRLLSADWKARFGESWSECEETVEKELQSMVTRRFELLELAEEFSQRSTLNPGFVVRSRALAHLPWPNDPVGEVGAVIVRARTRDTRDSAVLFNLETQAHRARMAGLGGRISRLRDDYGGSLGILELAAEQLAHDGRPADAADKYRDLLRRKSDQPYYAYRAAQLLDLAQRGDQSRAYWIHAARSAGSGWRSTLASVSALSRTYEWEVSCLRSAPRSAVARAATALGVFLEQRMKECWNSFYWPAAYALGSKAAQLYQLAAAHSPDSSHRQAALAKATELFTTTDDVDGLKGVQEAIPGSVYDSLTIPFIANPV
jgi:hypothetical protein